MQILRSDRNFVRRLWKVSDQWGGGGPGGLLCVGRAKYKQWLLLVRNKAANRRGNTASSPSLSSFPDWRSHAAQRKLDKQKRRSGLDSTLDSQLILESSVLVMNERKSLQKTQQQ